MVCSNCGKILEEGEKFCPACGTKVEEAAAAQPMYGMACTQNDRQTFSTSAEYKAPAQTGSTEAQYKEPTEAKPEKEKEFFGRGAFIFCVIMIFLLSASTTFFACGYFRLLGMI